MSLLPNQQNYIDASRQATKAGLGGLLSSGAVSILHAAAPASVDAVLPGASLALTALLGARMRSHAMKHNIADTLTKAHMPKLEGQQAFLNADTAKKIKEIQGMKGSADTAKNVADMMPALAVGGVAAPAAYGLATEEKEKRSFVTPAIGLAAGSLSLLASLYGMNKAVGEGKGIAAEQLGESAKGLEESNKLNEEATQLHGEIKGKAEGFGSLKHPGTWAAAAAIPYAGYKAYHWAHDKSHEKEGTVMKYNLEKLAEDVAQAITEKMTPIPPPVSGKSGFLGRPTGKGVAKAVVGGTGLGLVNNAVFQRDNSDKMYIPSDKEALLAAMDRNIEPDRHIYNALEAASRKLGNNSWGSIENVHGRDFLKDLDSFEGALKYNDAGGLQRLINAGALKGSTGLDHYMHMLGSHDQLNRVADYISQMYMR